MTFERIESADMNQVIICGKQKKLTEINDRKDFRGSGYFGVSRNGIKNWQVLAMIS